MMRANLEINTVENRLSKTRYRRGLDGVRGMQAGRRRGLDGGLEHWDGEETE